MRWFMKAMHVKPYTLFGFSLSKRLAFTAVFAALCAVSTLVVVIPLPTGYFNTGDVFVLLAGWCLGPLYGGVAAGVGSAVADIISGFAIYAPVTFFIKGAVAVTAYCLFVLFRKWIKREPLAFLAHSFSALIGEAVMVLGYFAYESVLYGLGGAFAAILGNTLQGVCCTVLATIIVSLLRSVRRVREIFPTLKG